MTNFGYPEWRYLVMNKIICDVCGTSYQESAECCPICGCTRDEAILLGEEFAMDEQPMHSGTRINQFSTKKKAIFDFDEVNAESRRNDRIEEVNYDEEERVPAAPRQNVFAVIVLTVLIAVLLLLAGFLLIRYFLPASTVQQPDITTMPAAPQSSEVVDSQMIPCQSLAITSGTANLSSAGAYFLVNVSVFPEDTTDTLSYRSADDSVATVDASGRITAVSEGVTQVIVTCGIQETSCDVICDFTPETVPVTEVTAPAVTEENGETAEATVPETVPETTETTEPEEVKLELSQTDFILVKAETWQTLRVKNGLDPEDVHWYSMDSTIAVVNEKGVVKAVGLGTTKIVAKYGDQEATCVVRCIW